MRGIPQAAVSCGGAVWVAVDSDSGIPRSVNGVERIATDSGRVVRRVATGVDYPPWGLACSGKLLWVFDDSGGVYAFDAINGRSKATFEAEDGGEHIAVTPHAVWTDSLSGFVTRYDLDTHSKTRISIGAENTDMSVVAAGGVVWASTANGGVVKRLSETTGAVTGEINTGDQPEALASSGRRLFIALGGENRVLAVDLANRKVIGSYPVGNLPDGLAVGDGALWVSYDADLPPHDQDKLTRIPLSTPLSPKIGKAVYGPPFPFKASYDVANTHWDCSGVHTMDSGAEKDTETCLLSGDTTHLVPGAYKGAPIGNAPLMHYHAGHCCYSKAGTTVSNAGFYWQSDYDGAIARSWTNRLVHNSDDKWTLYVIAHY